ncbi:helix-turn-helix domain-containing protein [Pseudonocardia sp. GCM10023141]|uniref:helix-turn-helix domain-containing protein n=1 Tax=Pseudonocardia sp. GCM10023141 TaxID=3252653 RepID=UPI003608DB77
MPPVSELGTLGGFLHASRARLTPSDVGLGDHRPRRVPGLRREEIAMLAGVSASYYTRLEQGQALNASAQVIDALSRALRLSDAEREHLHLLASAAHRRPAPVEPALETVDAGLAELLDTVGDAPAMVFGRRRDILAWNAAGHALLAGHLDPRAVEVPATRPNATELVFLDPHTRELYLDWQEKALASVGHLRILAAQFPDDARLLALIGQLAVESAEFASLWAANTIRPSQSAVYRMRHPVVGRLTVTQQLLTSVQAPGQTLVICSAPKGTSSAAALRLLSQP